MDLPAVVKTTFSRLREQAENSNYTFYTTLLLLTDNSRHIFFGVYLVISVTSFLGNVAAIYSISRRKYRCIQKTCIISLALSDILSTISIGVNNLETFSHPLCNWELGDFMCCFIPWCQFAGMVASSFALVFIALDRYRNVVHALSKRWNPRPSLCITGAILLWMLSLALTYPMYTFFSLNPIGVVYPTKDNFTVVPMFVCVTFKKESMMIYYILMTISIFLPLLVIFVWFYYSIASLVWKHRKPLSTMFSSKRKNKPVSDLDNSSSNTKTTESSTKEFQLKPKTPKTKDIRVERKIRTFKIIIALMVVFLACRLPNYIFTILKLTNDLNTDWNTRNAWIANYSFVLLNIVNCLLNPLLYTFLNQTLTIGVRIKKTINDFACEICCFCFSNTEFDDFEKGSPFVVDSFGKNRKKSVIVVQQDQAVLRSNRNSRVKFDDDNNKDPCRNTDTSGASSPKKY